MGKLTLFFGRCLFDVWLVFRPCQTFIFQWFFFQPGRVDLMALINNSKFLIKFYVYIFVMQRTSGYTIFFGVEITFALNVNHFSCAAASENILF